MNCGLYAQAPFRQAAGAEFRPGGLRLTDELAAACALRPGERVLDLGCGVGSTASHLSRAWGATVAGLDALPEFLAEARRREGDVEWVLGRADALPFSDCRFDCVFAECFVSSFADPGPILGEVRRVLRSGGRLALSDMYLREPGVVPLVGPDAVPAATSLAALAPAATCLCGARSKEATLAALEQHGFRVTLWEDRSAALKGLMAALIMAYGSAAAFWDAVAGEEPRAAAAGDCDGTGGAVGHSAAARGALLSAARPGYCMVVAEAALPAVAPMSGH